VRSEIFLKKPPGGKHLSISPINRRRRLSFKDLWPICYAFKLFWVKKTCFREENPSQGASITLSRHFREQIREDFPSFFTVLCPFFGLQSVSVRIRDFQFISCFCLFSSSSRSLSIFFFSSFNELFTVYLSRYLA